MSCGVLLCGIAEIHSTNGVGSNGLLRVSTKAMSFGRYPNHKSTPLYSNQFYTTQRCKDGKWTSPNACLVFSESGSKLYTNFEFCEEKNHRHFKNILIYKDKKIMMTTKIKNKKSKESLHILQDGASVVQVGDIEQVIV
jgi:hypothetical protein